MLTYLEKKKRFKTAYAFNDAMGIITNEMGEKRVVTLPFFKWPSIDKEYIYNTVFHGLTMFAALDFDCKKFGGLLETYEAAKYYSEKLTGCGIHHDVAASSVGSDGQRGIHIEIYFNRPQRAELLREGLKRLVTDKRVEIWPNRKLFRLSWLPNGPHREGYVTEPCERFNEDCSSLLNGTRRYKTHRRTFVANGPLSIYYAKEKKTSSRHISNFTRDFLNRLDKPFNDLTEEELKRFTESVKDIHKHSVTDKTEEYFLKEAEGWARNWKRQQFRTMYDDMPRGMTLIQYISWCKGIAKRNRCHTFVLFNKPEYANERGITIQHLNRLIRRRERENNVNLNRIYTGGKGEGDSNLYLLEEDNSKYFVNNDNIHEEETNKYRTLEVSKGVEKSQRHHIWRVDDDVGCGCFH